MKLFFRNILLGLLLFSISTASLGMEFYLHYCPISKESKYVLEGKKCCGAPAEVEDDCCHTTKEFKKTDPTEHSQQTLKLSKLFPLISLVYAFHAGQNVVKDVIQKYSFANPSPPPRSGKSILISLSTLVI